MLGREFALSASHQIILVTPAPNLNIVRYAKNQVMSPEMRRVASMKSRRGLDSLVEKKIPFQTTINAVLPMTIWIITVYNKHGDTKNAWPMETQI